MNNDKIVTPSFCYILAANFLLFFAFYLILPILPFYLKEEFMIGKSMIGFILSCYTLAALWYPSVRRIFTGYFRPPSLISGGLFHFHRHIWRIHGSHGAYPLYRLTHRTRFRLRHGDGGRKYDTDRYLALLPPWGRYWLLRPSQ